MTKYKLRVYGWLAVMAFLCSSAAFAQDASSLEKSYLLYEAKLDSAVNNANKQELLQARRGFQELAEHSAYKMLATYYMGYAEYRLSSIFEDMEDDQKAEYLNAAIKRLEQVTELAPQFAEGWALLGNCYGMKATGIFSAMRYGPKSESAIEKALQLAPENPRVVMINGIGLMHKPGMFGGSVEKAIQAFKKANNLFQVYEPASNLHPDWGQAENYAWLAQAYLKQNEKQQARQAYQSALDVKPGYYWVKVVLLPELMQQMN